MITKLIHKGEEYELNVEEAIRLGILKQPEPSIPSTILAGDVFESKVAGSKPVVINHCTEGYFLTGYDNNIFRKWPASRMYGNVDLREFLKNGKYSFKKNIAVEASKSM